MFIKLIYLWSRKYPNGAYIGNDFNPDAYNEVLDLIYDFEFDDIELFNSKLEDLTIDFEYDITFTSIPYFDLESYSNNIGYENFDHWRSTFISKLLSLPRLLINMDIKTCKLLGLTDNIDKYIINSTSHFNKKDKTKKEVIVKLNF